MLDIVNIADFKAHLSEVITQVQTTGNTVIIGKYGKPVAKISPYTDGGNQRSLGFGKHLLTANVNEVQQQVDASMDDETLAGFYS